MKRFLFVLICLFNLAKAETYYFSDISGDDDRTSIEAQNPSTPWKSINKLNTFFSSLAPGDSVLFKKGEVFYGTIIISQSGSPALPIVIGAYGTGANPAITGMVPLNAWSQSGTNTWITPAINSLPATILQTLLIDGKPIGMGRYPNLSAANSGYLTITGHTGTSSITSSALGGSPNYTGAEVVIRSARYSLDRCLITNHSGTTITYTNAIRAPSDGFGFFIQNSLATLDQQDEWYHNVAGKTITMYSVPDPSVGHTIEAAMLTNLLVSTNFSNITISNINFRGSNGSAISVSGGSNITIKNSSVYYAGINGISGNKGNLTTNFNLDKDSICYSANGGIYYYTNNGKISNTIVHSSGMIPGMGQSNSDGYRGMIVSGNGLTAEYNTIDSSGSTGILVNGDNLLIQYNLIRWHDIWKDDAGGGIYMQDLTNPNRVNRVLKQNIILHGIGAKEGTNSPNSASVGIFLDDGANHIQAIGNTVAYDFRAGYIHQGNDIRLSGNTFLGGSAAQIYMQRNSTTLSLHHDTLTNNILFNTKAQYLMDYSESGYNDIGNIGRMDSNYYIAPTNTTNIFHTYTNSNINTYYSTVAAWNAAYPQYDANSFTSPVKWGTSININDSIRLEYNAGKTVKTVYLDKEYIDIKSNKYTGSVDLQPFTSLILLPTLRAPSVNISAPVNDTVFSAQTNIAIKATATDVDGTVSKVDFYNGNVLLGTDNTSPYSFTWNNVAPGSYSLSAKATDNSLLESPSAPINIRVNEAPVINISTPAVNTTFAAPANISITATASDVDGSVSKVEFYNGSTLLGSDITSPYTFIWNDVPAGNYSLSAKVIDNDAAISSSSPVSIVVNEPPTIIITDPSDNEIFAAPAIISITAAAADADGTINKVDFYNGSTLLGTDNTSPYVFTWNNVPPGNYSITAKATDDGSLVTTSGAITVSVNSAPAVSVTSPANNTLFAAPASIAISAAADDADGTITKVEFYNGNTLIGTSVSSPYTFTWTNVSPGNYQVTAKATDDGSFTTVSPVINISVNTPPTVSITAPANNTSFVAPASIPISASAADADGTISKVDFYNGSTLIGTDATSPYSFTWTNVTSGNYSITAKATDNTSLVTNSAAVAVSVNSAPGVSITSPANNTIFAAPASITINATATDVDGTISKVDFYNGSTLIGTDVISPYSFTWNNVAAGNYSITAKATDNGSLVTTSPAIAISVNSAPTVNITSPVNNASFNAPASITIKANASDPGGAVSKVAFYNGSTLIGTDNTSPYSITWTNVPGGTYTFTAKATDNSSLATTSAPVVVSVNSAPTVSIASPANNTIFASPATIIINATAADADGTVSKVDFYNGTKLLGTDNSSPYSFTWNNVTTGNYSLTAKATDNKSLSKTSAVIAVAVNTPPTVSITSPAKNTKFNAPAAIVIKASAADPGGAITKVEFYNGGTLLGTDQTSPYSFTWTNVPSGNYSLTAKAIDNSSLATTSAAIPIVVNGAPAVSITSPANNSAFTSPAAITINAAASDPGGSISKVAFYNGTTLLYTDNTSPYSYTWSNVPPGNYNISAKATDNSSMVTTSASVAVSVASALTVSITSPPNNSNYAAPANITILAAATSPGGSVSKVDFYNGTTLLGTDNTSPFSFSWTNVPLGNYTITAKATDNWGTTKVSAPTSIIVTQSISFMQKKNNIFSMIVYEKKQRKSNPRILYMNSPMQSNFYVQEMNE